MATIEQEKKWKFKCAEYALKEHCKKKGYSFESTKKSMTVTSGKSVINIDEYLTIEGPVRLCAEILEEATKAVRLMKKCDECIASGGICGHITRDDYFFLECDELEEFRKNDYV